MVSCTICIVLSWFLFIDTSKKWSLYLPCCHSTQHTLFLLTTPIQSHKRYNPTQSSGHISKTPQAPLTVLTSQHSLPVTQPLPFETTRGSYPKIAFLFVTLAFSSSTCSQGGKDLLWMLECTTMHSHALSIFLRASISWPILAIPPGQPYLFHIMAHATIWLNGAGWMYCKCFFFLFSSN